MTPASNEDSAPPPVIRRASAEDACRLSLFAATVFRETFAAQNTAADMEAYVRGAFDAERQAREIADPSADVLLVEAPGARPEDPLLGYAHLAATRAPACVTGPAPIELKRFYVASAAHGRGVARVLMDATLAAAHARGARTLWLGVWERNARAIAFYGKHAFQHVGEQTFVLGSDVQTDRVMARAVTPAVTPPAG